MSRTTTADPLLAAVAPGSAIFDLGRPLTRRHAAVPQPSRRYWHALPRRHGDMVRADGGSAANDMITMGTHVGTHIDALAHVSQDGKLLRRHRRRRGAARAAGTPSSARTRSRRWSAAACCSTCPRALGVASGCDAGYEITVADLEAAVERQGIDDRRRRRGARPQRLGPALRRRRPDALHRAATPASRASARPARTWLADQRRARRRRRHHRLRVPRARRRARAAAGAPGAPGRARHLHHRGAGPRGAGRRRACTSSPSSCRR